MTAVYLTEQFSVVRYENENIFVTSKEKGDVKILTHTLDRLVIFGTIHITTPALHHLLENKIPLIFLSFSGKPIGSLNPADSKNVFLRRKQYELLINPDIVFAISKKIINTKIKNGIAALKYNSWSFKEPIEDSSLADLGGLAKTALIAKTMDSLRGLEGIESKKYMKLFAGFIEKNGFEFKGRVYHPSPDPINAMLSLCYSLMTNSMEGLIFSSGLDATAGLLHFDDYGRASLACDFVEPFRRPFADRFVLYAVRKEIITNDDFYEKNGISKFKKDGIRRFLQAWHKFCEENSFVKFAEKQVDSFKNIIDNSASFNNFSIFSYNPSKGVSNALPDQL